MVEKMKSKETFQRQEIGTGDIVTYCEDVPAEELHGLEYPTVGSYYEHILNSIAVYFKDRTAPKDASKQFTLILSKKMNYQTLSEKVAKYLDVDPLMIRFVSHNIYNDSPKIEIRREPERILEDILQPNTYQQSLWPPFFQCETCLGSHILYYYHQFLRFFTMRSWTCPSPSWRTRRPSPCPTSPPR